MIWERNFKGLETQLKNNIKFLKIYMKIGYSKEDQPMAQYKWSSTWYYYIDSLSRFDWSSGSQEKSLHWNQWDSLRPVHTVLLIPFAFIPAMNPPHFTEQYSLPFPWKSVSLLISHFFFFFLTSNIYASCLHSESLYQTNKMYIASAPLL